MICKGCKKRLKNTIHKEKPRACVNSLFVAFSFFMNFITLPIYYPSTRVLVVGFRLTAVVKCFPTPIIISFKSNRTNKPFTSLLSDQVRRLKVCRSVVEQTVWKCKKYSDPHIHTSS